MNDINSWKCFHKGVFPLLGSTSLKNTDLEVNSLCCFEGANAGFLPSLPARQFCFLPLGTIPGSLGEDRGLRTELGPQRHTPETPEAPDASVSLSVSALGHCTSSLWTGHTPVRLAQSPPRSRRGDVPESRGVVMLKWRLDPSGKNDSWV